MYSCKCEFTQYVIILYTDDNNVRTFERADSHPALL